MRTGQPQMATRAGVNATAKATATVANPGAANTSSDPQGGAELEMEKVKAVGDLELEYVTWSLPKPEPGETRGRTKSASITPSSLFEPGAYFLKSSSGSENSWLKKRCSRFHTTVSTRCVRDIKREFSWKIYGVCCNQESGAEAHYVRIKFSTKAKDQSFATLVELLNALAAKRFLQSSRKDKVRPFGIGFDCGVQKSKERLYIISNCAKQTPFLRRVAVEFEVQVDNDWKRLDASVDRIGFATYKSAPKSSILAASTLDAINFKDDAYLRFARVTLRFGEQTQRTVLDVGKSFEPQLIYTKTSTILTLNRVRVRTCEGTKVSAPVRTQVRLVFTDIKDGRRGGFRRNSFGKHSSTEAEKVLALLKKTVQLAGVNTLGLEDELDDDAIFQMNIQRVVTNPDFSVRAKGEIPSTKMSLSSHFKNSTLFLVPCYESNGVNLILQSRNGEYVLRQYVTGPVKFIGSIAADSFAGPKFSTLRKVGETNEYDGSGKVTYMFETRETDATALVEILVSIIEKLHNFQTIVSGSAPGTPSVSPFVALPPIPNIPSIHLSRPVTATTFMTTRGSTRVPSTDIPPVPTITTTPPTASPTPAPTISSASAPPPTIPPIPTITPVTAAPTIIPVPASPTTAAPPTTIYKVPRKPVPSSSHSRASSTRTAQSVRKPVPSSSHSSASSTRTAQSVRTVATLASVPEPQTLPPAQDTSTPQAKDRLSELRAATLKRVITSLETGLQGTVQSVSRVS